MIWIQACAQEPEIPPPPSRARAKPQAPQAQPAASPAPAPQPVPAVGKEAEPEGEGEEKPEKPEKPAYTYDPGGRPDPFKSVLARGIAKNRKFLPPLQRRDISEMRLTAVVWGELGKMAMLEMPDGKGYSVVEGTKVGPNDGVIKRITPKDVLIVERYTNIFGEIQVRKIVLELRPSGEKP